MDGDTYCDSPTGSKKAVCVRYPISVNTLCGYKLEVLVNRSQVSSGHNRVGWLTVAAATLWPRELFVKVGFHPPRYKRNTDISPCWNSVVMLKEKRSSNEQASVCNFS